MDKAALFSRLQREERESADRLWSARLAYTDLVAQIGTRGSSTDERLERLRQAGVEVRRLNQESIAATKRMIDYLMRGTVPEGYEDI